VFVLGLPNPVTSSILLFMAERAANSGHLRAAQYVRMSTDHQQYSTQNQSEVIVRYAKAHGLEIVRCYADAGRSGLSLAGRKGLQDLIRTVESKQADFGSILVYDVSRWGRFQDADESAYYEYLCKRNGITVHYCAEPFENDDSPPSNLIKALKRSMAGEYSRELSHKVFAGQARLSELGFHQGGQAGFGLRRLLVDQAGIPKAILGRGQQKSIQTDRVRLVPGPPEEVAIVREIFHLFTEGAATAQEIADLLNTRGIQADLDRGWTAQKVHSLLINPKYIGANVYNRRSFKLKKKYVYNPREMWFWRDNAFDPLISEEQFLRAKTIIQGRRHYTDQEMLDHLRQLLAREGKLSGALVDSAKGMSSWTAYNTRFGGLVRAYKLIGYTPSKDCSYTEVRRRIRALHEHHLGQLIAQLRNTGAVVDHDIETGLLTVNREFTTSFVLVRCRTTSAGNFRWLLSLDRSVLPDVVVAARLGPANQSVLDYFLLPNLDVLERNIRFLPDNPIVLDVYRFSDLAAFVRTARRVKVRETS
jgi:DNA invertase Pin-like site-specific DNA recombinase